jgi:UDP-GlcNAc:undecaprenyl-phosphate GlcNAc-1-phosphate transferase
MLKAIAPLLIGFLVSVTMMLALRPVATQLGLVDVPGGRKTHVGEVPVIGGIAIFFGLLAAVLSMNVVGGPGGAAMLVSAGVMVIVGALDDRFDLPPNVRILAHLAAVLTMVLASGLTVDSLGNLFGLGEASLGRMAFIFTVVAAIALINAFNMLDGLDGLAGGAALIALSGLAYYFVSHHAGIAGIVSLSLVGAIGAFMIFNVPWSFNRPLLAFMGDAGSTLLGFVMAALALIAVQPRTGGALPPVVVLWLLPVPILELFTSTFRRLVTGLSPMKADRGHFHHKLLDAGFSVRAIFLLYMGASSVSAVAGLWMWQAGVSEPVLFYSFLVLSLIWLAGTHSAKRLAVYLPESLKRGQLPPWRRRSARAAVRSQKT